MHPGPRGARGRQSCGELAAPDERGDRRDEHCDRERRDVRPPEQRGNGEDQRGAPLRDGQRRFDIAARQAPVEVAQKFNQAERRVGEREQQDRQR